MDISLKEFNTGLIEVEIHTVTMEVIILNDVLGWLNHKGYSMWMSMYALPVDLSVCQLYIYWIVWWP